MVKKTLGDRIRLVREQAGLSQEAFAAKAAVTPATINRYEKGHRVPDADFLNQLVIEFKCEPGWLLTGEEITLKKEVLPPSVAEGAAVYNVGDVELREIMNILKHDLPDAKKYVLKILKSRKGLKEGMEGLMQLDKKLQEG